MYQEIEGQLSIGPIIFDEDELIAGGKHYPYTEIESLAITSAPAFAAYGILTLRTHGRDIPIPFPRARKGRLERALKEFNRLREKGDIVGCGGSAVDANADRSAYTGASVSDNTDVNDANASVKSGADADSGANSDIYVDAGVQGGRSAAAATEGGSAGRVVLDPYEELKKLKELLDLDIVTQEEFDAKKKQLLDL